LGPGIDRRFSDAVVLCGGQSERLGSRGDRPGFFRFGRVVRFRRVVRAGRVCGCLWLRWCRSMVIVFEHCLRPAFVVIFRLFRVLIVLMC
jgi:hypothetical protein